MDVSFRELHAATETIDTPFAPQDSQAFGVTLGLTTQQLCPSMKRKTDAV